MSAPIISNIASSSRRQIASASRLIPAKAALRNISTSRPSPDELSVSSALTATPPPPSLTAAPRSRVQLLSFPPLTPLPRPHGIHVASLHLAAHHPYPLDLYTSFSLQAAHSLGIPTSNPAYLPTVTSLYTVPKSPFVHKKSQENFERRNHRRVIKVWDADRGVVDLWLRYLKRHGIGGVGMRAKVFEWVEPGEVGKELGKLGEEMQAAADKIGREVQEKADELVKGFQEEVGQAEQAVAEETPKKVEETVDGA